MFGIFYLIYSKIINFHVYVCEILNGCPTLVGYPNSSPFYDDKRTDVNMGGVLISYAEPINYTIFH